MGKVLVVDDSEVARRELVDVLQQGGFATAEAENGRVGLSSVKQGGVDLVITDVHMPEMSGIEMCEALHAALGSATPPILVISTESNSDVKARGKKAGVRGWIIKPADPTKLVTVIRSLLKVGT